MISEQAQKYIDEIEREQSQLEKVRVSLLRIAKKEKVDSQYIKLSFNVALSLLIDEKN